MMMMMRTEQCYYREIVVVEVDVAEQRRRYITCIKTRQSYRTGLVCDSVSRVEARITRVQLIAGCANCCRLWWLFHRCKQLQYVNIDGCALLKGQVSHYAGVVGGSVTGSLGGLVLSSSVTAWVVNVTGSKSITPVSF